MYFKVLFTGDHATKKYDNYFTIDPIYSSVVYIDDGLGNKMLFDTGSLLVRERLLTELKKIGVTPDDITHLFLTHLHFDHIANCNLFRNAQMHHYNSYVDLKTGLVTIFPEILDKPIPKGITKIHTPGHTADHVSYFFTIDGVRYCFAGDAFRENIFTEEGISTYYEGERRERFFNSLKIIFENSDVIIPGHFDIVDKNRKLELEEILNKSLK